MTCIIYISPLNLGDEQCGELDQNLLRSPLVLAVVL